MRNILFISIVLGGVCIFFFFCFLTNFVSRRVIKIARARERRRKMYIHVPNANKKNVYIERCNGSYRPCTRENKTVVQPSGNNRR